ncbi:MAG: cadherin-like beta sandwich domain-containing protein [Gammaproteobacteria bacterium]
MTFQIRRLMPNVRIQIAAMRDGGIGAWSAIIEQSGSAPSADAALRALRVAHSGGAVALTKVGGDASPGFAPAHLTYSAAFTSDSADVTITPTARHPMAGITIGKRFAPAVALASGGAHTQTLALRENTLDITVTAQNGAQEIYTLMLTLTPSTDAALQSLGLSAGVLRPKFAAGDLTYRVDVANTVTAITFTARANHPGASVTVNGGAADAAQMLQAGENTIAIVVTAQSGATMTYTLTITRPLSSDATLRSLALSAGTLETKFAPGAASYNVTLPNSTTAITLTAAVNHARASVRVGGESVADGQASAPQTLLVGVNRIEIEVTAEDGASMIYVVIATREPSANANLSALSLSGGAGLSQVFRVDTLAHTVSVGNTVASVTITPTVEDTGKASVTVDGAAVTSGQASGAIDLDVNVAKMILVIVTAEDGVAMKTYTLRVTRAQSSDNTLSGLTLSDDAELDSAFAADTLAYSVMVAHAVTAITLTPVVNQPDARVTVGGDAADVAQALDVGPNPILIVVTAQNGTTKTYTLTVTRAKSPDATLSALEISDGTLAPNFAPDMLPDMLSYTASVTNATTSITITATATHADAKVTVAGGAANSAQSLIVGDTTILIVVTAADELATKTYTLRITRAQAMASSDSSLRGLSIAPGQFAETFAATTLAYTAALANSAESVTVTPMLNEPNATVTVDGSPVAAGQPSQAILLTANVPKTILLIVTAQDAAAKTTYTLRITRAAGAPGLPQNLMAIGGAAKLRVTWEAPDDENGAAVTGYKIRWKLATATDFGAAVAVSGTAHSILGLAAGDYQAQILAVNAEGDGGYSDSARATAAAYGLDVNESGGRPGASDGILLARYLLGVRGAALVDGQGENAGTVEDNVQNGINLGLLDIDGDSDADGTDGILLARALLGLRGDALSGGLGLDAAAKAKVAENLAKFGR